MALVVLDTNVFVSALLSDGGPSREVLRLALKGQIAPLMGDKLFHEYEDVLSRRELFKRCPLSEAERERLLNAFLSVCKWVSVFFLWRPNLPDEGDNHVVELAVAGGAQMIITQNERDFRSAELKFVGIEILSPITFLRRS